ncbi:helix-turn-helix transcriptional regulator [Actinophytocola sp.]|uniref:helix-turn-helix transcriptional regulator n=1 Tax=Actinophytocola sp. TaxID=1872138 RepID=UPI002ED482CC
MDNRKEIREFLLSRRAKITPAQAGLPAGDNRRVPGLRRSEVAALADVSIEYYSKLERGALAGVSPSVLDAIARALQLDDAERAHLFDLARAADGTSAMVRPRRRSKGRPWTPHRSLQWTLDAVTAGPAFVRNGRMDLLAANRLARAFYSPVYESPQQPPNIARFQFLDPASHEFYPDWESFADVCVAILHTEAGRNPHDKELHDLVGELSTRSDDFRTRWGAHDVRHHSTGSKTFHHPVVGDLTIAYEGLEMAAEPGLTLTIYTAEPGSPSEAGLRMLASLTTSQNTRSTTRQQSG